MSLMSKHLHILQIDKSCYSNKNHSRALKTIKIIPSENKEMGD